jgi:cell division protein FtsW (lipid II flippase)
MKIGGYAGPVALPGAILTLSAVGVLVRSRMAGSVEGFGGWSLWIQPLGFVWMWFAWVWSRRERLETWRHVWGMAYLMSLMVITALLVMGSRFRGAMYGPGGMTPSELLKIFIPVALAGFFATDLKIWDGRGLWNPPVGRVLFLGVAWAGLCGLLVLQRDLGMVVLLSLMLMVLLVQVTRSWSWAVISSVLVGSGGWLVWTYVSHGARRLEAWLDLFADPTGSGWQVLQGLSGLYAGGLAGTGFGEGEPDRLPIASSDFVYAVYGEELGFLGCVLLLVLVAALIRQGARSAARNPKPFSSLLAVALTAQLAIQFFVNIAGVVTLLPVTGITLPYISQGGSSFWVASIQFGLLMGIGDLKRSKKK